MAFDFRREYEYQLSRGEELQAALGTPLTVVSLTGAVLGTMLGGLRDEPIEPEVVVFWCVGFVAAIVLVRAVYHFARSLHGHVYKAVESPVALREHRQRLREWHALYGNGVLCGDREFDDYLEQAYATATAHNQRINEFRIDQLFLGQRWMIRAAIVTGLAGAAFVANQELRARPPERVLVAAASSDAELHGRMGEMTTTPNAPAPPKPAPPPLREIHQGHVPPPPRSPGPER